MLLLLQKLANFELNELCLDKKSIKLVLIDDNGNQRDCIVVYAP